MVHKLCSIGPWAGQVDRDCRHELGGRIRVRSRRVHIEASAVERAIGDAFARWHIIARVNATLKIRLKSLRDGVAQTSSVALNLEGLAA